MRPGVLKSATMDLAAFRMERCRISRKRPALPFFEVMVKPKMELEVVVVFV